MPKIYQNGLNGRLCMFIAPHPAFAEMNDDRRYADLVEHAAEDMAEDNRIRRAKRLRQRATNGNALSSLTDAFRRFTALFNPRRMP